MRRQRAYYQDEVVTVLDPAIGRGKGAKTRVRTAHGFVKDVPAKDLKPIPKDQRGSVLTFDEEE